jgi:hypothetical protein
VHSTRVCVFMQVREREREREKSTRASYILRFIFVL